MQCVHYGTYITRHTLKVDNIHDCSAHYIHYAPVLSPKTPRYLRFTLQFSYFTPTSLSPNYFGRTNNREGGNQENCSFYCLSAGNYSCIVATFHLSRSLGYHLVQSYLPTILMVFISWVSFWMDVNSVPGRVTLGITTLLTVSHKATSEEW
jgi:hypothetical protein